MFPAIMDGDLLTLEAYRDRAPQKGDIAAFITPETKRLTVHRIIKRKKKRYQVKGDRCFLPDGLLSREDLIARVVEINAGSVRARLQAHPMFRSCMVRLSQAKLTFLTGSMLRAGLRILRG